MDVIRHQAQRVNTDGAVHQEPYQQANEVLIVAAVGEESAPIVSAQYDVVRHSFEDQAGCSWHAPGIDHRVCELLNDSLLRSSAEKACNRGWLGEGRVSLGGAAF